jgi:hypothetical protein
MGDRGVAKFPLLIKKLCACAAASGLKVHCARAVAASTDLLHMWLDRVRFKRMLLLLLCTMQAATSAVLLCLCMPCCPLLFGCSSPGGGGAAVQHMCGLSRSVQQQLYVAESTGCSVASAEQVRGVCSALSRQLVSGCRQAVLNACQTAVTHW